MARPLRIERPGAWYHITARGNDRRTVFEDARDRRHFCELLAESTERFCWRIHAYVLMGNHYHVLLETPLPNLSAGMQWFGVSYTVWFNRRHERVGHLFQGRFKAILIDPQAWGLALTRYIHLNPVRLATLGLGKADRARQRAGWDEPPTTEEVRRRLGKLHGFRWSSYLAYIDAAPAPHWLTRETILQWLGPGSPAQKSRAYGKYVEDPVREGLAESPWEHLCGQVVLGSRKFLKSLGSLGGNEKEQPSARALRARPPWERIVRIVEQEKGEPWPSFCDRHADWGRDLALHLGRQYGGLKLQDLADAAGGLDYRSVQKAIVRFTRRAQRNKALARALKSAVAQLSYDEI